MLFISLLNLAPAKEKREKETREELISGLLFSLGVTPLLCYAGRLLGWQHPQRDLKHVPVFVSCAAMWSQYADQSERPILSACPKLGTSLDSWLTHRLRYFGVIITLSSVFIGANSRTERLGIL